MNSWDRKFFPGASHALRQTMENQQKAKRKHARRLMAQRAQEEAEKENENDFTEREDDY